MFTNSNNNLIKVSIIVLLSFNAISLAFVWGPFFSRPEKGLSNDQLALEILKKELSLTSDQVAQFSNIQKRFIQSQQLLHESMQRERQQVNELIFRANNDSLRIAIAARRVADLEFEKEMMKRDKFDQLKEILNSDQQIKLIRVVNELTEFLKPKERVRPRGKRKIEELHE